MSAPGGVVYLYKPQTYIRWKQGEERRTPLGRMEPLGFDHDLIGWTCDECQGPFHAGDRVTLFAIGPQTRDTARKADDNRWFSALASVMHEECAWREVADE